MSSLKSYFRLKKHRYETQADLKDMTAEQIVNINPKDVGNYLKDETGGIPLEGVKRSAMTTLLAIKKYDKERPNEKARQGAISRFLESVNIKPNPEVDKLMLDTHTEMMKENLQIKDMENRLRKLNNQSIIPDTEEEAMARRLQNLGGKRKRRTVSKRKRREKTRKGRKASRKTYRRK